MLDAVYRKPGGVSFTVKWHVETSPGKFAETEDPTAFNAALDWEADLVFPGPAFKRICRILDAAGLPGWPVRKVTDLTKLSGVKAQVELDSGGKIIAVRPRGWKPSMPAPKGT